MGTSPAGVNAGYCDNSPARAGVIFSRVAGWRVWLLRKGSPMAMLSNLDLIRRVPLFSLLTNEQAQGIADSVVKRRFRREIGRAHV